MKKITTLCTSALLLFFTSTITTNGQVKKTAPKKATEQAKEAAQVKEAEPAKAMDNEAMMKAWQEYATPGEVHKMMSKDDGLWSAEVTMWMDPSAPPTQSKGTMENKMIFDGRYQQSTFKGDMMGMPFEGLSTLGYDNARKVFINTWIDNMGTGFMYMEGKFDPEKRVVNFKGKMTDFTTGNENPVRETYEMVDDNTQVMTMYETKNGKEVKIMEIRFTR